MNAVLWWKEYRQQRAVWLAIVVVAVLLVWSLGETMGRGSGLWVFRDNYIRPTLNTVLACLAVTYGIISGAMLLAGEKEDGTLVYLDTLTGRRGPVWARKVAAGMSLTLLMGLALGGLAAGLGFASLRTARWLPLLSLDALAWGLLGGALCRTVLTAVLAAIPLMAIAWTLAFASTNEVIITVIEGGLGVVASYASWRIFSRDDRSRQPVRAKGKGRRSSAVPGSWRVLWWLALRQGRWILIGSAGGAVLLGCIVNTAPLVLWPLGTLLLGMACGLCVFSPDQNEAYRFLGSQRIRPGRIWTAKVLFWAMALVELIVLTLFAAMVLTWFIQSFSGEWRWPRGAWEGKDADLFFFMGLWPLYGFCFGQFFGQTAQRPFIAAILTVFTASLTVCLWLPSLLVSGVPYGLPLVIPVLVLVTSRLTVWPWICGRLLSRGPLAGIVCAAVLMAASVVGFLWYRAVEVPDLGEPFDERAFIASLPSPEKNEAGRLLRHSVAAMKEHRQKVEDQLGPPTMPVFPKEDDQPESALTYVNLGYDILEKGWPRHDEEIGRWLDQIFQGEWVNEAQKAVRLPLGMLQDPRLVKPAESIGYDCGNMAFLFVLRALQLQARGDFQDALNHVETVLALSRQLKNDAPMELFRTGDNLEYFALRQFYRWSLRAGLDKDLLQAGLAILQQHEAVKPDSANALKAQYLIERDRQPSYRRGEAWIADLFRLAAQVPWEKERQERLSRAVWWCRIHGYSIAPNLSAKRWQELTEEYRHRHEYVSDEVRYTNTQRNLHAIQIVLALGLYQADHGQLPAKLDDLVPTYLATLPLDPFTDQPFKYRISAGEEIDKGSTPLVLAPGQALLWNESDSWYLPVPVWGK